MNTRLFFSQLLLIGVLLSAIQPLVAEDALPAEDAPSAKELIASWTVLSEQRTRAAGRQIYEEAIQATAPMLEEDPQGAAHLLFKAAELCRDMNEVRYTITLFDKAIEAKPEDPHFRRVYGDYLIGYRGLREQAWEQLYTARKLAKEHPEKVNDEFNRVLKRSIHIFRRDTGDGVLTFERNGSDGALIYENEAITITGGLDTRYSKVAKDALGLSTEYFRTKDFFEFYGVSASAEDTVERRVESFQTLASFLFRVPNADFPAVRLSYLNSSVFNSIANGDAPDDPFDLINDSVVLELEKIFIIKNDLFLAGDLSLSHLNRQTRSDLYDVEETFLYLTGGVNLRKDWSTKEGVVRLNLGSTYQKNLFDFEAYPRHSQNISLRNSRFLVDPVKNNVRQRFRGRRSSSQEIGLIRNESRADPEGIPKSRLESWRFFVANEELGLVDGLWDIYTAYSYRENNLSGGTGNIGEGSYSVHEFSVQPIWVPVYDLYENDFVSGWEFVTVGFPMRVSTSEGPYDRFTGGINVRGNYVVSQARLTLSVSAGVEYANYTEADREDLGGFIRFSIF